MSISIVEKNVRGKVSTYRGFIADTIADLASLPVFPAVAMGSECYCSEDGNTYILETDGDWVIKKGSGGGGSSETLPAVTTEDNGQVLTVVDGEWNKAIPTQVADLVLHAKRYYPEDAPEGSDPVFEVDMSVDDFLEYIDNNPDVTVMMTLYNEAYGPAFNLNYLFLVYDGTNFVSNHLDLYADALQVYQFKVFVDDEMWVFEFQHGHTNFTMDYD